MKIMFIAAAVAVGAMVVGLVALAVFTDMVAMIRDVPDSDWIGWDAEDDVAYEKECAR